MPHRVFLVATLLLIATMAAPTSGVAARPAAPAAQAQPAAPLANLLPAAASGWTRTAVPQHFGPDNLWEYIDGGADQYLSYGFQDVVTARYSHPSGLTATVDIYAMAEPVGAFGIYAQEDNPKAGAVTLGVEGQAGVDSVRFWAARYYVKLSASPASKSPKTAALALAGAVAAGLGKPGARPRELALFPAKALVPGSIRFIPANVLGQARLVHGFEAKYQTGAEPASLVVIPLTDETAARAALAGYEKFLRTPAKPGATVAGPGNGGFIAEDRFHGRVIAVRTGRWIVIALGAGEDAVVRARLTETCAGIAKLPPAPRGKAGL